LTLDEVSSVINEEKVRGFLAGKPTDPAETFYRNIRRLLPAHEMTVDSGGKTGMRRYWTADARKETKLASDEDYAAAFLELFKTAVKRRIPASGTVGATLSGGLDSSSVCVLLRRLMADAGDPRSLHAFSLAFSGDDPTAYEEPYIQEVLSQNGLIHHRVSTEGLSPFSEWREMMKIEDQPLFQITFFLLLQIYRACKEAGVTTLLDGMDGDMTAWHASNYWFDLLRSGRFVRLGRELKGTPGLRWNRPDHWKKIYGMTLHKAFNNQARRYPDERARHAAAFNEFRLIDSMETIDRMSRITA
jgi:asparagine synthase (glutamine-hydrolysing)